MVMVVMVPRTDALSETYCLSKQQLFQINYFSSVYKSAALFVIMIDVLEEELN